MDRAPAGVEAGPRPAGTSAAAPGFYDVVFRRRDVRAEFTGEPVDPDVLRRVLEAAHAAPSVGLSQPWDFVLVTERARLRRLSEVWVGARHVAGSAATIALIAPLHDELREQELVQYDLGQATMSIMLAAADLGIGSGHSAVGDQDLARELLGFPPDRFCAYLVALGHPAGRPLAPLRRINRRPFDEVVHRGRW